MPAPSDSPEGVLAADWLGSCRRMVEAQRVIFAAAPGIGERTVYEGVGVGGDHALAIDRRCEDIVFAELESLNGAGHEFRAISEERGEVSFGSDSGARVGLDPLDGSLNARRTIPAHCLSVAVASGDSMADVEFAYVYDFGASEEFVASRGEGARVNGHPLSAQGPGHGIEVVGLESADPSWLLPAIEVLRGKAFRVRSVGAIALSLSYVAAGRFDGMFTARACRSVDAAGAQLIAREAGAVVEFEDLVLGEASLSLDARYRVAAGLDNEALELMLAAQAPAG
ncbi:MAG: inositol monophosphatase family protein [Solirubrobacterales bacterium]